MDPKLSSRCERRICEEKNKGFWHQESREEVCRRLKKGMKFNKY